MRAIAFSTLATLAIYSSTSFAGGNTYSEPKVKIDNATVVGITDGTTKSFLGIPFAQPP